MPTIFDGTKGISLPDGSIMTSGVRAGGLVGLVLSTAGSSATFSVAVGRAVDSTNMYEMVLASAYSKTTSAWVVGTGNGGIANGTVANSTWYHVHLIKDITNNIVDVLFSTSATAPTLPTGYTIFRRIGSMKTNGSAQWTSFLQIEDHFHIVGISDASPGTQGATLTTMSVPTGVRVIPFGSVHGQTNGSIGGATISTGPGDSSSYMTVVNYVDGSAPSHYQRTSWVGPSTNTSAQIYVSANVPAGTVYLATHGWIDSRGKN